MSRKQRRQQGKPDRAAKHPPSPAGSVSAVTADQLLNEAIVRHRAGHFGPAEALYRQVLDRQPDHADALHLLGVVTHQLGYCDEAIALIRRALALSPNFAAAHNSLGNMLRDQGRHDPDKLWQAAAAYRRAIALHADYAEAYSNLGATLQRAGKAEAAAAACRQALEINPGLTDAHYNLGFALRDSGRLQEAVDSFRRVLEHNPAAAEARYNLGLLLQTLGTPAALAEAVSCFRHVLASQPDLADVRFALANTLQLAGQFDAAITEYGRTLDLRPGHAEGWNNRGVALRRMGRLNEAVVDYRRALEANPDYAEAYVNLGRTLQDQGALAEAEACLHRAAELAPGNPEVHVCLGRILQDMGRFAEAAACHARALALAPDLIDALVNQGVVCRELGRFAEALTHLRRALALDPGHVQAVNNLGTVVQAQGDAELAELCYRRALELDPDFAVAHWNLALLLLARGELEAGWAEYGWRFIARQVKPFRRPAVPEWQGEDLSGRRVMVWREQGVGDELMFASCLPDLIRRVGTADNAAGRGADDFRTGKGADGGPAHGHVIIECDRRLVALFARSFPQATVRAETGLEGLEVINPPDADRHIPVGSLPRWLRPGLESFVPDGVEAGTPRTRSQAGYLVPEPRQVALWRDRLATLGPGLRVGICWRSRIVGGLRGGSYAGLRQWAPVLTRPGIHFVRLQYDECAAEIRDAGQRFGVTIHQWPELDLMNDFDGVAALMANLDLVITGPTSVGELAGALGVPVWRVSVGTDWSMLGTERRPWFPTMRLFYAQPGQTLDDMLERMAQQLPDNLSP